MNHHRFIHFGATVAIVFLTLISCHRAIKSDIQELKQSLSELTQRVNGINNDIGNLNNLVSSGQNGLGIASITEQKKNGAVTGYAIVFSDGHVLTIPVVQTQNGSAIGLKQGPDGKWYWTWNGEWLTDSDGHKIPGGQGGITPQVENRDGNWWVSYDDGQNWEKMDGGSGSGSGSNSGTISIFKNVTIEGTDIIFTLADNSTIRVPRSPNINIAFSVPENTYINPGETMTINWTLSGELSDNVRVTASSDGNYVVKVNKLSATTGTLEVSCPKAYADGYINVMVTDGQGYTLVKVINFFQRELTLPGDTGITGASASLLTYSVPTTGGTVTIPWSGNYEVVLNIRGNASSWISGNVTTRAAINGDITLTVSENTNSSARTGLVDICPANNPSYIIRTVEIVQASAYFTIDRSRINVTSSGDTFVINMTSSRGLLVQSDATWLSQSTVQSGTSYTMTLTVTANGSGASRDASILLKSEDGTANLGEILVHQLDATHDNSLDMVIEVSANVANEFQVYLPLYDAVDCYIDWGDGTFDIVKKTISETNWVSHTYSGLIEPTLFDVRISGSVSSLSTVKKRNGSWDNSSTMPALSAIRAVKQWGDLKLTSMKYAFYNALWLYSIAADHLGAFSRVSSFASAFSGCTALSAIPAGLFDYGTAATDFSYLFQNCTALSAIPAGLFEHCTAAMNFSYLFQSCTAISSIPTGLFEHCTAARYFSSTFSNTAVTSIPAELFSDCTAATNFSSTFSNTAVTSIPAELFSDCTAATNFDYTFSSTAISSIPGELFEHCTEAVTFNGTFRGTNIESIPAGLFNSCTQVKYFGYPSMLSHLTDSDRNYGTFAQCRHLQSIPDGLFDHCHNVVSFTGTFSGCTELSEIPVAIFDNCRLVQLFVATFYGCSGVSGESPFTLIEGNKVHLYERKNWPDYFVAPVAENSTGNRFYCFYGCSGLIDYSSIPSFWKNEH